MIYVILANLSNSYIYVYFFVKPVNKTAVWRKKNENYFLRKFTSKAVHRLKNFFLKPRSQCILVGVLRLNCQL